ncbi:hypothetical protein ACFCYH_41260, partial [Streptomyces sp. NPDC056400]|uniref:hypothetical protein n=1 Tax=Streptomyces sp. NPDC056400 TaxID=3345808 RepID=UPI0035E2984D
HPPKWTGYQLLALIFGTLLSSQGTDASFVLTLSGFPPGFRSVLAFPTLSDSFVSDFLGAFQVFAFALSLSAVPTLPEHFRTVSGWDLNWWPLEGPFPFGRIRLYQVSLGLDSRPPARTVRTHVCAGVPYEVET